MEKEKKNKETVKKVETDNKKKLKEESEKTKPKKTETKSESNKIAVIRVRGGVRINRKAKETLMMLRLLKKNWCIVLDKTPENMGMIKVVKDYITYGEINKETFDKLMKKGEKDKKGRTKPFRLSPPKGGFERKGIKTSFKSSGALGYRADKINDLIKKML
jgi:large subunit ribosomal protein L30